MSEITPVRFAHAVWTGRRVNVRPLLLVQHPMAGRAWIGEKPDLLRGCP